MRHLSADDKISADSDQSSYCHISEVETSSATSAETSECQSEIQSIDSHEEDLDNSLCDGSALSTKNFQGMFLALTQKHNLSSQAMDSILKLIKLALPEGNNCPVSGYQFERSLSDLGFSFTKYITCCECQRPLERDVCMNVECRNAGTQAKGDESSTFYVMDLLPEIKRLISGTYIKMK